MPIAICGVHEVPAFVEIPLNHIISIRDSRQPLPDIRGRKGDFTLHSFVFDDTGDTTNQQAVSRAQMERLIVGVYSRTLLSDAILFQCFAGVSRSSAAAFIWLVHKGLPYDQAYQLVVTTRGPFVCPNQLMVGLADDIMGKRDEMSRFLSAELGRRAPERDAYFAAANAAS